MAEKETNPKDALGISKVPMSCVSSHVVTLVAQAYLAEELNELDSAAVCFAHHWNAAIANLLCFWEGIGDELNPPHLARMMAHTMYLRSAELERHLIKYSIAGSLQGSGLHVADLNAQAAKIIEKYPDCVAPFTELPTDSQGFKLPVCISKDLPLHVLPWRVVMEMALGMMEGGRKYGRHNYREVGVRASAYFDATMRHLADSVEGTIIDKDSGLPHLSKALSSTHVLLDSMVMGNWIDDRPIRIPIGDRE